MQAGFVRYGEETVLYRAPDQPLPDAVDRTEGPRLPDPAGRPARRGRADPALRGGDAAARPAPRGAPARRLGAPGRELAGPAQQPRPDPALRRRRGVRPGDRRRRQGRHPARRVRPDRRREGGPAALPEDPRPARRRRRRSRRTSAWARSRRGPGVAPATDRITASSPRCGPTSRRSIADSRKRGSIRSPRVTLLMKETARPRRRAGPRAGRRPLPEDRRGTRRTLAASRSTTSSAPARRCRRRSSPPSTRCPTRRTLIEVVLDLGRRPEARFPDCEVTLLDREIAEADIAHVVEHIGTFGDDNRAGIERTLHRISAIRNRNGKIVGLTCRIGRAVYGTIEIIGDFVETGKSILIMGRPGIGKTTMLREAARVLADDLGKRVVVVDTSNEIAGDGDIPHPAIGKARRMQVRTPSLQHEVMIEAVENHMPQVIVIDEIGTELEAQAARTIAERGVQLIGTAHGNNLDNLMLNPTLSRPHRRDPERHPRRRGGPPPADPEERPRAQGAADLRRDHRDPGPRAGHRPRRRRRHRRRDAPRRPGRAGAPLARRGGRPPLARRGRGRRRASRSARSGSPGSSARGQPWRMEPGWRGDGAYRRRLPRRRARRLALRSGYRPGASGGWRQTRGGSGPRERPARLARQGRRRPDGVPGERFAVPPLSGRLPAPARGRAVRRRRDRRSRAARARRRARPPTRAARDARELERQKAWRDQATGRSTALKAEEGTGPVNADDLEDDDDDDLATAPLGIEEGESRRGRADPRRLAAADAPDPAPGDQPEAPRAGDPRAPAAGRSSPATSTRRTSS